MEKIPKLEGNPAKSLCRKCRHDDAALINYLTKHAEQSLYLIADLDASEKDNCIWWINTDNGEVDAALLLYKHPAADTLLPIGGNQGLQHIFATVYEELPKNFHIHVFLENLPVLENRFRLAGQDTYWRMCLARDDFRPLPAATQVVSLNASHRPDIEGLLAEYPDNFFTAQQLATGYYRGIYHQRELASMSGVHAYSETHKIAALGNIVTRKSCRNMGLAQSCTSALVTDLFQKVDLIGLNVRAGNAAAIRAYEKIGFERLGRLIITQIQKINNLPLP